MEPSSKLSAVKQALLERRLKSAAPVRDGVASTGRQIPKRPHPDWAPLSSSQRQMWVTDQKQPGNPACHLPYGYRLRGLLDLQALEDSFNAVIKRHESLRTTIAVEDGEPLQRIHDALRITLEVTALDRVAAEEREVRLQQLASEESVRAFEVSRLPLIRVSVFKLGETEHVLLINMHHIVADGLSIGLLVEELDTFYRAFTGGRDPQPPELAVQYGDFAVWQRRVLADASAYARQTDFWRTQLAGKFPVLALPFDKPRPAVQSFNGANVFFQIPPELADALKSLGERERCTVFMTLLAAFHALLQRYSGAEDLVIWTPVAARTPREVERLIGTFLTLVPLRCSGSGDPTFIELLGRGRETSLNAFSHGDVPFEALMRRVKFERDPGRSQIFQVMLQVLSNTTPKIGDLDVHSFYFDLKFAQFDLSLHLYEEGGGYHGRFEYCADLFHRHTIEQLTAHFEQLLRAIVAAPQQRASAIPIRVDHTRLPGPQQTAPPRGAPVAPRTATEEMVLGAFREVLDRSDFGVLDDFFDLGGHSLMAARLMSSLRTASGLDLPLRDLFERPSAAALAEAIDALSWAARAASRPPPPATTAGDRVEIEL